MACRPAVERYFYLMIPYSVTIKVLKAGKQETRTKWVTNIEKREEFIKRFKQKGFDEVCRTNKEYAELRDIPIPDGFKWVWSHFLEIWRHCESDLNGNRIFTPRQINDYCECFGVNLTVRERKEIMMFEEWAEVAISKLRKKDNDE